MSGIRHMANHLCPRCLVSKKDCHRMGMVRDMKKRWKSARRNTLALWMRIRQARNLLYVSGKSIRSRSIQGLLDEESLVPVTVSKCYKVMCQINSIILTSTTQHGRTPL